MKVLYSISLISLRLVHFTVEIEISLNNNDTILLKKGIVLVARLVRNNKASTRRLYLYIRTVSIL